MLSTLWTKWTCLSPDAPIDARRSPRCRASDTGPLDANDQRAKLLFSGSPGAIVPAIPSRNERGRMTRSDSLAMKRSRRPLRPPPVTVLKR